MELEMAVLPREHAVGGVLALLALVVDRIDELALAEHQGSALAGVHHGEHARRAVQHQQLSEVEQSDEPELAGQDAGSFTHGRPGPIDDTSVPVRNTRPRSWWTGQAPGSS